jgi:hypothetical protein
VNESIGRFTSLDAGMFTIDMIGGSFRIWIGLGGQNSGPFPFSEQSKKPSGVTPSAPAPALLVFFEAFAGVKVYLIENVVAGRIRSAYGGR